MALAPGVGVVSTASIWILVFLTMIPTDPLRAGMTAAASAAMVPLGIWITQQHGIDPVRPDVASILWQATAIMAMVAFAVSRVLYQMGTAVSAAREMGRYEHSRARRFHHCCAARCRDLPAARSASNYPLPWGPNTRPWPIARDHGHSQPTLPDLPADPVNHIQRCSERAPRV